MPGRSLLLHGFPTSSHMFRNLIPLLADHFHVVAPDLPGFGFSDAPDREHVRYTFENLANVVDRFTQTLALERYAVYIFDYGSARGTPASIWRIRTGSPRSCRRTATLMRKA
jgi:pimeloyl-ACP methyl ester carboxylesterase